MTDDVQATASGLTAGAMLRAAREQQGVHIALLAAAIKVSPRKLDALENDRYEELPDATFVRALALTVCRALKIDAQPVLARLPQMSDNSLDMAAGGLNMPFRDRPVHNEPGGSGWPQRPLLWAGALLLAAAAVIALVPTGMWSALTGEDEPAAARAPAVAAPASASEAATAPMGSAEPASAAAVAPPATASAATVENSPAVPSGAAASAPPPSLALISTREQSWVEAVDAGGQVLVSRIVLPGETVRLQGALPIRLKIGNARTTQLVFRGQPVDLAESTRDNVARLELR